MYDCSPCQALTQGEQRVTATRSPQKLKKDFNWKMLDIVGPAFLSLSTSRYYLLDRCLTRRRDVGLHKMVGQLSSEVKLKQVLKIFIPHLLSKTCDITITITIICDWAKSCLLDLWATQNIFVLKLNYLSNTSVARILVWLRAFFSGRQQCCWNVLNFRHRDPQFAVSFRLILVEIDLICTFEC